MGQFLYSFRPVQNGQNYMAEAFGPLYTEGIFAEYLISYCSASPDASDLRLSELMSGESWDFFEEMGKKKM